MAFGAGHGGGDPRLDVAVSNGKVVGLVVGPELVGHEYCLRSARGLEGQLSQKIADFSRGENVVHFDVVDGTLGHARVQGSPRVLHHRETTPLLDTDQTGGTI